MSSFVCDSVLLDLNVLLDNFFDRDGSKESRKFILFCAEHDINMLYPMTAPSNLFYIITRKLKKECAKLAGSVSQGDVLAIEAITWAYIESLQEFATPVPIDLSDLWMAGKYRSIHSDLEDNLVFAAMNRSGADYLITNDAAMIAHAPVAALTPKDALALLNA